jgi:ABC-type multidrug transport system fused ATPase/permease subunit
MGFFAGLNDEKYDRQYTDRVLVGRMVNYFHTQTTRLILASVFIILLAIIGAALPIVVSRMVDLIKGRLQLKFYGLGLHWLVLHLVYGA